MSPIPTPPHQLGVWRSVVSSPMEFAPAATWRFVTFYRLTKPLLVSILLILNLKNVLIPAKGGAWPKLPNGKYAHGSAAEAKLATIHSQSHWQLMR